MRADVLATSPEMASAAKEFCFLQNTQLPMLALAAQVSMRPVLTPYVSFLVDNFQTAGCNIYDLASDETYLKIINSRPEFSHPIGHWSVDQRIGNGTASLLVREDCKEIMAHFNEHVASLLQLQQPALALRVACTVLRRGRNGRLDYNSYTKVFLTPPTTVSPPPQLARLPRSRPAALSPSEPTGARQTVTVAVPGSYAARLADGLKRVSEQAALDHRPRKERRHDLPQPAANAQPVSPPRVPVSSPPRQQQSDSTRASVATIGSAAATLSVQDSRTLEDRLVEFEGKLMTAIDDRIIKALDASMERILGRMDAKVGASLSTAMSEIKEMIAAQVREVVRGATSSHSTVPVRPALSPGLHTAPQPPKSPKLSRRTGLLPSAGSPAKIAGTVTPGAHPPSLASTGSEAMMLETSAVRYSSTVRSALSQRNC